MRIKTKCRNSSGKDRAKEASKRLRAILKTSRKLCVSPEDLIELPAVTHLRTVCRGGQDPSNWLFLCVIVVGALVSAFILLIVSGRLSEGLSCTVNNTEEIQIQTIRLDRLSLDGPKEEPTLFNDSEDSEENQIWQPPRLRLRRER